MSILYLNQLVEDGTKCASTNVPQGEASGGKIKTFSTRMHQRKLRGRKQSTIKMIIEAKVQEQSRAADGQECGFYLAPCLSN